jgi:ubiquinone/menaquinone biosynthesis C-methylase UbiE
MRLYNYEEKMNKSEKEFSNLKKLFGLTAKEAQEYFRIVQQRIEKEIAEVGKLNLLKGKLFLECSTGQGKFTQGLLEGLLSPNQTLYSIDSTPGLIKGIRLKIRKKNFQPKVADLWNLPFPDNYFDALVSHYTLHSLRSKNKNFMKPFQEMVRVLKPGAPFISMTFYYDKGKNLPAYYYHRLFQLSYQDKMINFLSLKKPRFYIDYLRKAGLRYIKSKIISYESLKFPEELRSKIWNERLKEEEPSIKKIKSLKLRREAQGILKRFEDKPELKSQGIGPTILIWGKKER